MPPASSDALATPAGEALRARLEDLGRSLAEREREHAAGLAEASRRAKALRQLVAGALEGFHTAVEAAGASQLRVEIGPSRPDEKHLRSVQFDLERGRYKAIVTVKSRGEVTLVGPFRTGKTEGPCKSFPFDAHEELVKALGDFLEAFLLEAATP